MKVSALTQRRTFVSAPRLRSAAVLLMTLAPVIWLSRAVIIRAIGPSAPVWVWTDLPPLGVLFFAAGWIALGAALRPAGSAVRGASLAALLYVACGLLWTFGLQIAFGRSITSIVTDSDLLIFGLQWPVQIAQIFGLFGMSY